MIKVRNRVTKFLLLASYNCAKLFASGPIQFDYKTGKITSSFLLLVYTILLNTLFVILLPFVLILEFGDGELFQRRPLAKVVNYLDLIVRSMTFFATVLCNWVERSNLRVCINEFYAMQRTFFKDAKVHPSTRRRFDVLIFFKLITTICLIFALGVTISINTNIARSYGFTLLFIVWVQGAVFLMPNHFYFGVLLGWVRFQILNERLETIVEEIKVLHVTRKTKVRFGKLMQMSCDLADQVDEVARCWRQNLEFLVKVTHVFQLPISFTIITFFITTVVYSFYELLVVKGQAFGVSEFYNHIAIPSSLVVVVDFLIIIYACNKTLEAAELPRQILSELTEYHPPLDERLDMSVEEFLLIFIRGKLQFRLFGMVDLDRTLITMMCSSAVMYLVILIQADYKNLVQ